MAIKPISPKDISSAHKEIPDIIIKTVNEMIKKKWDGSHSVIFQKELLKAVKAKDASLTSNYIFDNNFFDFEPLFRKAGWKVTYDSPAFNEDYEASFMFEKK